MTQLALFLEPAATPAPAIEAVALDRAGKRCWLLFAAGVRVLYLDELRADGRRVEVPLLGRAFEGCDLVQPLFDAWAAIRARVETLHGPCGEACHTDAWRGETRALVVA